MKPLPKAMVSRLCESKKVCTAAEMQLQVCVYLMLMFSRHYPIYTHNLKFSPVLHIYYNNYVSEHLSSRFKELGQNDT